jgi:glutathione S-transferase
VDGKKLAQSGAILRYLANKYGLAGKNDLEKAKVDEIYDFFKDVYVQLAPYVYIKAGWREGNLVGLMNACG